MFEQVMLITLLTFWPPAPLLLVKVICSLSSGIEEARKLAAPVV
jgi:hypothetical protein